LAVNGLRVERAASLIELRTEGHATFGNVDATDVSEPAVSTCGAFRVDWQGSNQVFRNATAHGC